MPSNKGVMQAVLVAALGYFVDIYDLVLFSIVRVSSLRDLGIAPSQMEADGVYILNMQMVGMLLGGIAWGIMGDKVGRRSVLFGSILLYSMANLANAWVETVEQYAWIRLIAGFGLAGELGAGITLVSELMTPERRVTGRRSWPRWVRPGQYWPGWLLPILPGKRRMWWAVFWDFRFCCYGLVLWNPECFNRCSRPMLAEVHFGNYSRPGRGLFCF